MLFVSDVSRTAINSLLQRYGIFFEQQERDCSISGSFWGDSEAGIIGNTVYARRDTPVHSLLHETCHVICMTADRRIGLDSDAGGDDIEECAVCYLQLVLADHIDGVGQDQLMLDMDAWGYSFRRGSARDWFQGDAEDAVEFLMNHGLLDSSGAPTFQLRQ
jgi:hypothetical protein